MLAGQRKDTDYAAEIELLLRIVARGTATSAPVRTAAGPARRRSRKSRGRLSRCAQRDRLSHALRSPGRTTPAVQRRRGLAPACSTPSLAVALPGVANRKATRQSPPGC